MGGSATPTPGQQQLKWIPAILIILMAEEIPMDQADTCSASPGLFLESNNRAVAETGASWRGCSSEERPNTLQEFSHINNSFQAGREKAGISW